MEIERVLRYETGSVPRLIKETESILKNKFFFTKYQGTYYLFKIGRESVTIVDRENRQNQTDVDTAEFLGLLKKRKCEFKKTILQEDNCAA